MQWELWLLGVWFLAQALRRTCESAHHKVSGLLEEFLRRFESNDIGDPMPAPEASGMQQEETGGPAASAPPVSANPSIVHTMPPSESQLPVVLGLAGCKEFKEDGVWHSFFSDPAQWWDNRFDKRNPRAPDFKHKLTRKGLWISGRTTPDWVRERFLSS